MIDVPTVLKTSCSAKLNLALAVGAVDPASGRHPIASWMTRINFADELTIRRLSDGDPSRFDIAFVEPESSDVDWPIEKDLAYRAHRLLEEESGRDLPIALTLGKRIPAGAGLAGGSSNAAGVLLSVSRMFGLGLSGDRLVELGYRLGADVAFCVWAEQHGSAALVSGMGERLEALPIRSPLSITIVLPGVGCSTGEVYAAFDHRRATFARRGDAQAAPSPERVRALASGPVRSEALFNDLADAAGDVEPVVRELRRDLARELKTPVHVTGSGSTLFALAPSDVMAQAMAVRVREVAHVDARAVRTC